MPTYPDGFPAELIAEFSHAVGRAVIGNAPSEGLRAIEEHGALHLETGALIVYTSADSVFQVAAHVDVVPEEELYACCLEARSLMSGPHAVGRVIARPFSGAPGSFARTGGRRDFALPPPGRSYLDEIAAAGVPVHAVGKVGQVFAGRGVSFDHHAPDNASALAEIDRLLSAPRGGPMFVFANLVDTDQLYGHRKDVDGFHAALQAIDAAVARWLDGMGEDDLLVLCADHGCDPWSAGTDHTREYSPLLAVFNGSDGHRVEAPLASVGASALHWLTGRDAPDLPGDPFAHGS
jgi:phosphopentomutase